MPAKRFVPNGAGMTKQEIVDLCNCTIEVALEGLEDSYPTLTTRDLADKLAQWFVNEEDCLREECVDQREEDFVEARESLCRQLIETIDNKKTDNILELFHKHDVQHNAY
jgi:hypothetical protein